MKVMAAKGLKCPKEGKPREYITDSVAVEVPNSAFYLRLVKDGSLVLVGAQSADPQVSSQKKQGR